MTFYFDRESEAPVVKTEKEDGKRHHNSKDHVKAKKLSGLIQVLNKNVNLQRLRNKWNRNSWGEKNVDCFQSEGVFSEASTECTKKRLSRRSGYSRESSNDRNDAGSSQTLEKPKLNLTPTINKAEEDERLRLLLRDDFIDDNKEILLDNAPVGLPLSHPSIKI